MSCAGADNYRYTAIPPRKDPRGVARHDAAMFNHGPNRPTRLPMKTWIKRTLAGVFGASVLLGGLTACGHGRHEWQSMSETDATQFRARMVEKVGSKLELDAAQKAKLAVLADKLREQRQALMGGGADPRAEMRGQFQSLIAGATFDRAGAQAMVEAKTAALRGKSPEVIAAAADFFDSLKPEQQQKVRDFLQKRGGWHRG